MIRTALFFILFLLYSSPVSAVEVKDRYTIEELNKLSLYEEDNANGLFGFSVAVSGDICVVGAYGNNTFGTEAGSAYVFRRNSSGNFVLSERLYAPDGQANDRFGFSVSISGEFLLVSAYKDDDLATDSGSVHVFRDNGEGRFIHSQKLLAGDGESYDYFGKSLAVDGDTAIIGAYADDEGGSATGSAYIFLRDADGNFSQTAKLTASDPTENDYFGFSVDLSGDIVIIGAYDGDGSSSGSVYVFTRDESGNYTQTDKLLPLDSEADDRFGYSVAVDADILLVGAYRDDDNGSKSGSAYIFKKADSGTFVQQQKLTGSDSAASDFFGASVALSEGIAIVGAYGYFGNFDLGGAYVFRSDGDGIFAEYSVIKADDGATADYFGRSVAVDGDTIFAGAHKAGSDDSGAVYLFEKDNSSIYAQIQKIVPNDIQPGDSVGSSVAIAGNFAVLGAPRHGHDPENTGAAYIYTRQEDNSFIYSQKLLADDASENDNFGASLAISGETILIGAPGADDHGSNSGSVYVFRNNGSGTFLQVQELTPANGNAGDQFGAQVGFEGATAVVSSHLRDNPFSNSGSAYVFEMNESNIFSQSEELSPDIATPNQFFGNSVAVEGDTVTIGAYGSDSNGIMSGAVYVFKKNNGTFVLSEKLVPSAAAPYQRFGASVAMKEDILAVIAAGGINPNDSEKIPGAGYVFTRDSEGDFYQVAELYSDTPSAPDSFGSSVTVGTNTVVIGAHKDQESASLAGAAYVFADDGNGGYTKIDKLIGSEVGSGDGFGYSMAMDDGIVIIGSPADDNSGSAYAFGITFLSSQEILKNSIRSLRVITGQTLSEGASLTDVDGDGRTGLAEAISSLQIP